MLLPCRSTSNKDTRSKHASALHIRCVHHILPHMPAAPAVPFLHRTQPVPAGAPPPPTTLPPVTLPNTTFYCGSGLNFSATAAADNFTYSSNVTVSGRVVQLAYDMYSNPDRLRVYDGRGALVYDSGYVGLDFACAVSAQVQAALVDSGNGCQGLTGPSRVSQTVPFCCEEFSPCPTPASINIARGTDAPEVFTFTVDSPCANSAWALEFGCPGDMRSVALLPRVSRAPACQPHMLCCQQ